jgi:restriction endonuclease S subunit
MKCHTKDGINPFFIVYQLHQSKTQRYYRSKATGTAGNMPKINQTTVMNTPMVFVKKVKQDKIVESIELKLSVCNNIEQSVDTALQQAAALRQSILKQAFEGNL